MRIVHVIVDLKIGGLEILFAHIVRGQINNGHDVSVICLSNGGITAEKLLSEGIEVKIFDFNRVNIKSLIRLRREFLKQKADIAHLHSLPAGTFGRLSLLGTGIKTVYHLHTIISIAHKMRFRHKLIERILSFNSGKIITVSKSVNENLISVVGVKKNKLEVLSGGIPNRDLLDRNISRQEHNVPDGFFLISNAASLIKLKCQDVLIRAIREVENTFLIIAGDGPELENYKSLVRELGIEERVKFAGHIDDVHSLYSASDIAVQVSYPREGLPLTIMEAQRAGIPAIVSDIGGLPEIIEDGVTGSVIPPNDYKMLAIKIREILEDESKRLKMGRLGRKKFLEKFELQAYLKELDRVYS
jgi:glycosyltransferase involved in cell wall biosynthesis